MNTRLARYIRSKRALSLCILGFSIGSLVFQIFPPSEINLEINLSNEEVVKKIPITGAFPRQIQQVVQAVQQKDRNQDLANLLEKHIRVLCLVLSSKRYHDTKAVNVKRTWAKHCSKVVFVSDEEDPSLPAISVSSGVMYMNIWSKTRGGFQWAYDNHLDDFDWFLKADDDTFVIMENLRALLLQYNPNDDVYLGQEWQVVSEGASVAWNNGGFGYLLSRSALSKVVEESFPHPDICEPAIETALEDAAMGACLSNVGVKPIDTRDDLGRQRYLPYSPEVYWPMEIDEHGALGYIQKYAKYPYEQGRKCCSDMTISLHRVNPLEMLQLDYLIYKAHVFGIGIAVKRFQQAFDICIEALEENGYITRRTTLPIY